MRVLEADPSILYKMAKNKKHRIRKSKENDVDESSDEGQTAGGCAHITKAVNINNVRKTLTKASVSVDECTDCARDGPKSVTKDLFGGMVEGTSPTTDGEEAENTPETTICVCLQCGHLGCDRSSANKHALKHYKIPHTGLHCITVNLTSWSTWCYQCDDIVPVNARMQACIYFLQKMCGVNTTRLEPALSPTVRANDTSATLMEVPSSSSSAKSLPIKSPSAAGSCKVKGLNNLGNTCFFNAVMQSLCQTRGLESLLLERSKQDKMIIAGPVSGYDSDSSSSEEETDEDYMDKLKPLPAIQTAGGEPGPVTQALLGFMQEMKGGSVARNGTVNPTALFTQVCKKAPRFKGFQQQDSHELLRYLIDSIRTEEVRKGQSSILKFFRLSETVNPKRVDEDTKMKIKQYGRQVRHTFLDSMFGGQLVSTVKCEECKNVSQIYETFLDLSLPVMEEKPQRPSITLIGKKKDAVCLVEDGEVAVVAASSMDRDKPSKYQDKKNKRNAKREAKKKGKAGKPKTYNVSEFMAHGEHDEKRPADQDNGSDDSKGADSNESEGAKKGNEGGGEASHKASMGGEKTKAINGAEGAARIPSSPDGSKERLDGNRDGSSSSKDDSDADIEDNLEGDQARSAVMSLPNEAQQHHTSSECSENKTQGAGAMDVEHIVRKVEGIHIQEGKPSSSNSKENQVTSPVTCDMFTVDTCVNNFSNVRLDSSVKSDSDKENVLISSSSSSYQNPGATTTTTTNDTTDKQDSSLTTKPEVSAVFNITLPCTPTKTQTPSNVGEVERVTTNPTITVPSLNGVTPPSHPSALTPPLTPKGKAAGLEEEAVTAERKLAGSEDKAPASLPCQNGTKSRLDSLKEAKQHSMNTLAPRYQPAPKECSIWSCLNQFTAAELLTGSNKVGCKSCTRNKPKTAAPQKEKKGKETVYSNANKQYLIFRPPAVLTLHLKRFEQTGLTSRKVNRHVDFPLMLDLAPYCSSLCSGVKDGQSKVLYSLYGIVEHSGRLNGGHYTAYVKLRPGVTSHSQFQHAAPPYPNDMLNAYMERVLKGKGHSSMGESKCSSISGDLFDKDVECAAESLVMPGRWFHISDSRVNEVSEACVLKAQAYLLFYERIY